MCGLFGFYGVSAPDGRRLAEAAELAARRGPDGWGIVTELTEAWDLGRLDPRLASALADSRIVIGHCRLATVLGTKRVESCQPIKVGRFIVAHNGTVPNVTAIADRHGFRLRTGNDSEAIGHLLERHEGTLHARLTWALGEIAHGGHYALAVLDRDSMQIQLRARGIPLWRHVSQEGTYWCSVRPGEDWEPVHA